MVCPTLGLLGSTLFAHVIGTAAPAFVGDAISESREGYATVSWDGPEDAVYELQQASTAAFADARRIYRGRASAHFVSGLQDGRHHFRVRASGSDWSEPTSVDVIHHPLSAALGYFGAGAAVFLATATFLFVAARRESRCPTQHC